MIVTRTPLRISLGGGGTDLPNFAGRFGGELVSAAIDAWVYVTVRQGRLDGRTRFSYESTQTVAGPESLQEPLVRHCLRRRGLGRECEIVSLGGVPAGTGLGSSGAFTVGLLHALDALRGQRTDPSVLAEEAWEVEHGCLGRPVGKHDHYITALGGIRVLRIGTEGHVETAALRLPDGGIERLRENLLLFFTGQTRDSQALLAKQDTAPGPDTASGQAADRTHYLHRVKEIGAEISEALHRVDIEGFGALLHEHWLAKRASTGGVSNPHLDRVYHVARESGALGGKVLGAGGGGFFLFCVPEPFRDKVSAAVQALGPRPFPFRFAPDGTTVLLRDPSPQRGDRP
ncbi:galactokinase [Actinomadura rubrisoli]|uniref:Galactokinase n=1 Tax=Actinomadura rubrisoli TaxID=2530368 RepID=A0A4R5CHI9_9ACTN|nr:galactokinase [Actinomadura rubrisoli]TDD96794.1 galactokinase [Actinomadura rubrisoli]